MPGFGYGWKPDKPDFRDRMFSAVAERVDTAKLPVKKIIANSPNTPYNQLQLGSCTGQSIAGHFEYLLMKQGLKVFKPSALFIYYQERMIEGTVNSDAGAEIRDGIKSIGTKGVCEEEDWPYDGRPEDENKRFRVRPNSKAYANALLNRAIDYQRVRQTLPQMKACLAADWVISGGFSVYESFEDAKVANDGLVPMPESGEQMLGGHAILIKGYDDNKKIFPSSLGSFWVLNSWDKDWGIDGFFWIPYEFFSNSGLASDFWTVRLIV